MNFSSIFGQETDEIVLEEGSRYELRMDDQGFVIPKPKQKLLVQSAHSLVGNSSIFVEGVHFNMDCTGVVLAVYFGAGIDLSSYFNQYNGSGVERLTAMAESQNLEHTHVIPEPGDVIIWDNTYDKNGDGIWNDGLTHAGVVVSSNQNGDIQYIHHNYAKGIVIERMNLLKSDINEESGNTVNSPMRMRSHRYIRPDKWLSSHLLHSFAQLYDYK